MKKSLLLTGLLLSACSIGMEPQQGVVEAVPISESTQAQGIVCKAEGSYPRVSGLSSVQVEVNINAHFDEYAYGVREDMRNCPEQYLDLVVEDAELLDSTYVDYEIARLDDDFFSVSLLRSQFFEGAAHPNNWIDTFTFDMATGQPIELADLFADDSDYMVELTRRTAAAVNASGMGEYPSETSNPIEKYYLTTQSLVLVDLFSVHAQQAFVVRIPLEELKDIWNK